MASHQAIDDFVRDRYGAAVRVQTVPLRGGLEAAGTSRVTVLRHNSPVSSFVAKPFSGAARREVYVYRLLAAQQQRHLAPALLGWRYTDARHTSGWLFLEWIAAQQRWPWRDVNCSGAVMERLAALHRLNRTQLPESIARSWNYESELIESARSTMSLYRAAFLSGVRPGGRPMLPTLERVVDRLPRMRRDLMSFAGATLLHGDAHPGNAIMRAGSPLLLDWGRARLGSPLEDVASWLHTVAFWEPEARRRHDTLLERYRIAAGQSGRISPEYRNAVVIAGASNALAGALRYHLAVATDTSRSPRQRSDSFRAAADWLRLIRRADMCCR